MTALLFLALAAADVPAADQAAIFKAAGFARHGESWTSGNCEGAESESYSPGQIDTYRDINGDGRPEALATEGGAVCYGMTGTHFWLLSRQADGSWRRMAEATAMADFLETKGVGGWPDIQLGGPGFCFPVLRWNGKAYAHHRHQYEGKRCSP